MAKGIKTGGRRKGTPNKLSGTVKDNVIAVFDNIGGINHMTQWAQENPTEFYRMYSKLLPKVTEGPGENGEHEFVLRWANGR